MSSINEKRTYEELAPTEVTPKLIAKKLKSDSSLDQIAPELIQHIFSFLISNQTHNSELVSYLSVSKKINQQIKSIDAVGLLMNNLLGKNQIPSDYLESHLRNNFPDECVYSFIDEEVRQKKRQDSSFRLANLLTCDAVQGKSALESGLTKVALILSQHLNLDLDQEIKKNIGIKEFQDLIDIKNEVLVNAWSLPSKENLHEKDLLPVCTFIKQLFNLCPSSIDNLAKTRLPLFHLLISKTLQTLKSEYWNEKDRMVVIQSDKAGQCATLFTALLIILETLLKKTKSEEQQLDNDDSSIYLDSPEDGNILLCFAYALNDVEESSLAYHRFLELRDGVSTWELKHLSKRLRGDKSFIIKTLKHVDLLNKSNMTTLSPFLKSKDFVITLLSESPYRFTMNDIPEDLRKDPDIIFNVLIDNIAELNNIPEEAKQNMDLIRSAIQNCLNNSINYIPDFIAKDGKLFLELLRIFNVYARNPFEYLSESIPFDDQFRKTAFLINPGCLFWIPIEKSINDTPLFPSKELLIKSIQIHGKRVLEVLDDEHNIEAVFSDLKINPHLHLYLDDYDVLAEAIEKDPQSLTHATEGLRNERSLILKAVQKNGLTLEFASQKLQSDEMLVLEAVRQNGLSLKFASENLQNNKEIVLEAVNQNGLALNFASKLLKKDEGVVHTALKRNRLAKCFADGFKSTAETTQILYDKDSLFLDYLMANGLPGYLIKNDTPDFIMQSKGLMDDKKVILQFVQVNGKLLQHASERLKKDREVVFLAVSNCGSALAHAAECLKSDKQIVMAAIQNDLEAFKLASSDLRKDPKILELTKKL